ncbi:PREDICTED: uncharacterized protein LOC104593073 isoform X2 [Nelumbo nucifera]|uniref:Uncharacterized protein LOC104593073 isoform X2 n=1 Tax=Nelumbo nucifera TaxID=4432 RepID=A0A1U7ZBW5_NELNU|nr:PREDICTED: uncharacterized protein LOC104593073 isoform X2 [Nelumbo nucifera]
MWAARNIQRRCVKALPSLLLNDNKNNVLSRGTSSKLLTSCNEVQSRLAGDKRFFFSSWVLNYFNGSRSMSTARGRSMRSKVEKRMRLETGKTLREKRRAQKLRKKLMTDEERLIYNLRRALFKARFEQALDSQKLNIKKIEQQLRRMGVNPEDPVAMASIQRVASTFFNAIDKREGSPYVFHGNKQPIIESDTREDHASEDSDQEELDRFIAEIEDAASQEWEAEEAAEKEELGKMRYWSKEDLGRRTRRSLSPSSGDSEDEMQTEGRHWKETRDRRMNSNIHRWDSDEDVVVRASGDECDSDGTEDDSDVDETDDEFISKVVNRKGNGNDREKNNGALKERYGAGVRGKNNEY